MIFGIEEEKVHSLGATYTVSEIKYQPKLWQETFEIISNKKQEIELFLKKFMSKECKIVLTGAGTSAYIGDTIYLYLCKKLGLKVESIATTDIVSNPQDFLEEDKPTILVSYARSGNSPESIGAFDLFQENVKNINHIVITCNDEGELFKKANSMDNALCILMPELSNDKSFAMTSSFTCMLVASLLIFNIDSLEEQKKYLGSVVEKADYIMEENWRDVQDLVDLKCLRVVYLGSGIFKGLAKEMALKNLELTSGKVVSVCESVLGFRHGPKSIINDHTLIIFMNSTNDYTNLYDLDLIREINNDSGNHKLAVISYVKNENLKDISDKYIEINGENVPEIYTIFNYILFGQMFGLLNSIRLGISPDNPRPDGTVNRVVKGITIHKYFKS